MELFQILKDDAVKVLHSIYQHKLKSRLLGEISTHLNPEFQRIARRDKRAFLTDRCKEIEENNRMGKTRDLFRKIRDTKGTLHAKMGSVKDKCYGTNRSKRY